MVEVPKVPLVLQVLHVTQVPLAAHIHPRSQLLTWQKHGWLQLTHTMPTCSASATRLQRASSAEITAPASPNSLSLARCTASPSVLKVDTASGKDIGDQCLSGN